ncbi:hypothetical protein ACFPN0_26040 [Kitasatospora cinereorecta]
MSDGELRSAARAGACRAPGMSAGRGRRDAAAFRWIPPQCRGARP